MKYVRQFLIILVISFIGELLRYYIPLKIPASIYGLVLLFAALELRIIKLVSIRETSRFLIEIMPLMFVKAGLCSDYGHCTDINHYCYGSIRKSNPGCYPYGEKTSEKEKRCRPYLC